MQKATVSISYYAIDIILMHIIEFTVLCVNIILMLSDHLDFH